MFFPDHTTATTATSAFYSTDNPTINITAALIVTNGTYPSIILQAASQPVFLTVTIISCLASLVGSSLVVLSYACLPETRNTSRLLVVFISAADFLIALGNLMGVLRYLYNFFHEVTHQCDPTPAVCLAQAIITSASGMWSFFWTLFTAVYLYVMVVKGRTYWIDKALPAAHIIAWGIPVLMVAIALGQGALGEDLSKVSAGWCWVKTCSLSKARQITWMLLTGKLWEIVAWFISLVLYVVITCHVGKMMQRMERTALIDKGAMDAIKRSTRRLTFIPLTFFLLRIWGTLRFFLMIILEVEMSPLTNTVLITLQGFGDSSQGFFNSIIYCLSTDFVRNKLCTSCCKKKRGEYKRANSIQAYQNGPESNGSAVV